MTLRGVWFDFLSAVQFLTRLPVPAAASSSDSLPRAALYFPLVGLLIGATAALIHTLLVPHLTRLLAAFLTVAIVVLLTGALHEDGLADAADGFGGGWTRERTLAIMRDSRIGTYGAAALALSLIGRIALIASLPLERVAAYLIASHMLCRWTALPLSYWLPAARTEETQPGLGAKVARLTTLPTLIIGTLFTLVAVLVLLKLRAIAPLTVVAAITVLTGLYYRNRIGGVTGDCFGTTNQLAELGIYLCGVWIR